MEDETPDAEALATAALVLPRLLSGGSVDIHRHSFGYTEDIDMIEVDNPGGQGCAMLPPTIERLARYIHWIAQLFDAAKVAKLRDRLGYCPACELEANSVGVDICGYCLREEAEEELAAELAHQAWKQLPRCVQWLTEPHYDRDLKDIVAGVYIFEGAESDLEELLALDFPIPHDPSIVLNRLAIRAGHPPHDLQ